MEEPETPEGRARFIVARIESAMRDFSEMHPPLRDLRGVRVPASYRATTTPQGKRSLRVVTAHHAPSCEVDWSLQYERQARASKLLSCAMSLYVEGKVSLARVKKYYQLFADAHLVYWWEGRMFYEEGAAYLAAEENLSEHVRMATEAIDTLPLAHQVGTEAEPRQRPRLAYSRGRD